MQKPPAHARMNKKAYRLLQKKNDNIDCPRTKRPRYRRDESPEWRSFELANIDDNL